MGKYAVDVSSFEDVGVRAVETGLPEPHTLLVIDELGNMELLTRVSTIHYAGSA